MSSLRNSVKPMHFDTTATISNLRSHLVVLDVNLPCAHGKYLSGTVPTSDTSPQPYMMPVIHSLTKHFMSTILTITPMGKFTIALIHVCPVETFRPILKLMSASQRLQQSHGSIYMAQYVHMLHCGATIICDHITGTQCGMTILHLLCFV